MKKPNSFLSTLLIAFSFALFSCSVSDREIYTIAPENTLGVLSFHPGQLIEKGKIAELDQIRSGYQDNEFLAELFHDPGQTGINLNMRSAIFSFGDQPKYLCLVMPIGNKSDFEDFLDRYKEKKQLDLVPEVMDGYLYFIHERFLLAWDNSKAFLLSGFFGGSDIELEEAAIGLVQTEKGMSLIADKDFRNFLSDQKDISLWISSTNMESIPGMPQISGFGGLISGLKNNYAHAYLEFQKGALALNTNIILNPAMRITIEGYNFLDRNASEKILNYLPSDQLFFAANASLNPEKMFKLMKMSRGNFMKGLREVENALMLEEGQAEKIFNGDFAFSVNGLKDLEKEEEHREGFSYLHKTPVFTLVAGLKNSMLVEEIMGRTSDNFLIIVKDGFYTWRFKGQNLFLTMRDDFLIVSNNENNIMEVAESGTLQANIARSAMNENLTKQALCLFINLDSRNHPDDMKEYFGRELNEGLNMKIDKFGRYVESLTLSAGLSESELILKFSNDDQNSLYTILTQLDSL